MRCALYIGATGMKTLGQGLNVTANNLANINTIGYKQQDAQYSDLIYTAQANMGDWWCAQENSRVALGQTGKGVQLDTVRTIFQQGAFESSNTITDLAINGKGFFLVKDAQGRDFYTRAGDFRPDNQGVVRMPEGHALQAYSIDANGGRGALQDVQLDKFETLAGSATTKVKLEYLNVSPQGDNTSSATDPYFGMLGVYDGRSDSPLPLSSYEYSKAMTLYDSGGNARTVTVYFDGAPSGSPGSAVEFLIASPSGDAVEAGDGLLMSGVMQFSASGALTGLAAFTPTVAGSKDLSTWQSSSLSAEGLPQLVLHGSNMAVDFGIKSGGGWSSSVKASDIGADLSRLPAMVNAVIDNSAVTAYADQSIGGSYSQNGYGQGSLSRYNIQSDGTIVGYYSNGQNRDMWQIPLVSFTSEDGLRREGGNLFSYTKDAGQIYIGEAGTANFGKIAAYNIEQSNVDMASEMVDLIVTQRGFQSNSKVVTTSDEMLKRAIELKRS